MHLALLQTNTENDGNPRQNERKRGNGNLNSN
jgi:hypothetical protein